MGILERKERERLEMREKILAAATEMFIEEGYDKTSIRNIADKIEYSPATIYLYFKDKDELFHAIHDIGFQIMLKQMEKIRKIQNPFDRLKQLGYTYIDFALKNPEYYDLMFIMRAPIKAIQHRKEEMACWTHGETTFEFLQRTVAECVEHKLIKSKDILLTSMNMWSLVHGMVSLYVRERFSIMDVNETQLRKMLLAGLDDIMETIKK